jgi:hypothetical protein
MIKLNLEQKVARLLQGINSLIGVCAFVPASLCWFFTLLEYTEVNHPDTGFIYSSVLLIVFYGYTIISPRIYIYEYYNKSTSFWHWIIVFITNVFTVIHFLNNNYLMVTIVPTIPLIISAIGLIAHYNLNNINHVSNNRGHEV